MPPARRQEWEDHLRVCPECAAVCARMREAEAADADDAASNEMLSRIRGAIGQWNVRQSRENSIPAVKGRVADELAPYLGPRASGRILCAVSESADNLLSTVGEVMSLFLGKRAGGRFVDHVVEDILVRS